MTENFKQQLIKDHPVFFSKVRAIELDEPGWQTLICELISKLESRAIEETITCSQIREKSGLLKVSLNLPIKNKEIVKILKDFENRSKTVCYRCGAPGKLTHLRIADGRMCIVNRVRMTFIMK